MILNGLTEFNGFSAINSLFGYNQYYLNCPFSVSGTDVESYVIWKYVFMFEGSLGMFKYLKKKSFLHIPDVNRMTLFPARKMQMPSFRPSTCPWVNLKLLVNSPISMLYHYHFTFPYHVKKCENPDTCDAWELVESASNPAAL